MEIKLKRLYEAADAADGYRVLVDRLWPRGVKKIDLNCDSWAKALAPSTELRQWYHRAPDANWPLFTLKYRQELADNPAVRPFLQDIKQQSCLTLLYAANDPLHNHAQILRAFLIEQHAQCAT